MKTKKRTFEELLEQKRKLIDASKAQLKKEFFGIDDVIDQVMDTLSSWHLFPEAQEVPLVICLFGMTGVGKTSLIKRITELLNCNDRYFHLDADFYKDRYGKSFSTFHEMYKSHNGEPVILALDEFQHARTKNSMGLDTGDNKGSFLWDLLDSDSIYMYDYNYNEAICAELIDELQYFMLKGVKVRNGMVYSKVQYWLENMHNIKRKRKGFVFDEDDKENLLFVATDKYDMILEAFKERFNTTFDVKEHLHTLNASQTIAFLREVQRAYKKPSKIDCSKSLIFILGNIDEAFHIHNNLSPDISADEFYEQCKNINITHIKNALRLRFRSEHIARLGNNIVVYPSLNCNAYYSILENELQKTANRIKNLFGIEMTFGNSLKKLLYSEGVIPTQGARPLISTIAHHVKSNLSFALLGVGNNNAITRVHLSAVNDEIFFSYYSNHTFSHKASRKIILRIDKFRRPKMDDKQSIVAVHESGHAVLSGVLLNIIPSAIYSSMAGADQCGLVINNFPWKYLAKREILPRLAMYLGGYVAEKLIFGEDRLTAGSESDIENATTFVCDMLKSSGMGSLPAKFFNKDYKSNSYLFDTEDTINNEAYIYIEKAMALAEKTLKKHETLLLMLADKLSDVPRLEKQDIKEIFVKYAPEIPESSYITDGDNLYYRNTLKNRVKRINTNMSATKENDLLIFSLNKDKTE